MATTIRFIAFALICVGLAACAETASPAEKLAGGFIAVSAGGEHTCGIAAGGAVYCWGSDRAAQLGTRDKQDRSTPIRVDAAVGFVRVAAGAAHTCAIDSTGDVYCWGHNGSGQQGNGTTISIEVPTINPSLRGLVAITSGWFHSCGLNAGGQAVCWGMGGQGQIGADRFEDTKTALTVVGGVPFAQISAGAYHTCALALDGAAYCWGQNQVGQLGNQSAHNSARPVLVAGGRKYTVISAGFNHSCAVATDGVGYCWGGSEFGELGTRALTPAGVPGSSIPSPIFEGASMASISAGNQFSCAVRTDLLGSCWGRGFEGQLGNGQIRNWSTPQYVLASETIRGIFSLPLLNVSAGSRTHACGLGTGGAVYCWGEGQSGELGNPVTSRSTVAVRVTTN